MLEALFEVEKRLVQGNARIRQQLAIMESVGQLADHYEHMRDEIGEDVSAELDGFGPLQHQPIHLMSWRGYQADPNTTTLPDTPYKTQPLFQNGGFWNDVS